MLNRLLRKNQPKTVFNEPDLTRAAFRQYFHIHNVSVEFPQDTGESKHQHIPLQDMSLTFSRWTGDFYLSADLDDACLIWLPVVGTFSLLDKDENKSYTHNAAVISGPTKFKSLIPDGSATWIIKIERQVLERKLSGLLRRPITRPIIFNREMDIETDACRSWWRTVEFLLLELTHKHSILSRESATSHLEHLLIEGLLLTQPHNYSNDIEFFENRGYPVYMKQAEEFTRQHAQEEITIDDIVKASRTSYRTLYNGFKEFHGLSPMNYLRKVRMEGVRDELIKASPDQNVSTIAMQWAFTHLGRFSGEYKKLFGESPSATLSQNEGRQGFWKNSPK